MVVSVKGSRLFNSLWSLYFQFTCHFKIHYSSIEDIISHHNCFRWLMRSNGTTPARFFVLLILKLKNVLKYQILYSFQLSRGAKLFKKAKLCIWWTKIDQKTKKCPKKWCFLRITASLNYFFGNFGPRDEVPHIKTLYNT